MSPSSVDAFFKLEHSPEESRELLRRETEAIRKRFELKGPIASACLTRFWQVFVFLPYQVEPGAEAPDWSPIADPRALKVKRLEGTQTLVVLNGHPEWPNEKVIAAELTERRRLNAPAQNKY